MWVMRTQTVLQSESAETNPESGPRTLAPPFKVVSQHSVLTSRTAIAKAMPSTTSMLLFSTEITWLAQGCGKTTASRHFSSFTVQTVQSHFSHSPCCSNRSSHSLTRCRYSDRSWGPGSSLTVRSEDRST